MIEVITGIVLAAAAGLNAYIPLLGLGLLARFTPLIELPDTWSWLTNGWALGIIGVLLAVELLVDKVPALDSLNDVLQTVVRPASGGLVFSAGASSETAAINDPAAFAQSDQVWPFVLGVIVALIPHVLKALARPVLNAMTGGAGAPVMSFAEDAGAVLLTVLAVVVPVLALILTIGTIVLLIRRFRRARRMRRSAASAGDLG